jgi:hypothetical protein
VDGGLRTVANLVPVGLELGRGTVATGTLPFVAVAAGLAVFGAEPSLSPLRLDKKLVFGDLSNSDCWCGGGACVDALDEFVAGVFRSRVGDAEFIVVGAVVLAVSGRSTVVSRRRRKKKGHCPGRQLAATPVSNFLSDELCSGNSCRREEAEAEEEEEEGGPRWWLLPRAGVARR